MCTASLKNMARSQSLLYLGSYANARADEALLRTQKIQAIKRPSLRSQRNVHTLIHNTESLVYDEADWIREGTDLAALGCAADRGWLNTFLENTLNTISRTATRVGARHRCCNVFYFTAIPISCGHVSSAYRHSRSSPKPSSQPCRLQAKYLL